tara:strand:- start:205 stop:651 length:447 start_codon:yes stop_codon:yes gene_type:complete
MKVSFCLVGFTFLFSSIYMSILKQDKTIFQNFNRLLNPQQKEKYDYIVKERLFIYIFGMTLGLLSAYLYYINNKNDKYLICKLLTIVYVIKLAFYYFFPKSPLMLYSLNTKQQTDAWADIYTEMKNRWIVSLIVGFFGYLCLSFALSK